MSLGIGQMMTGVKEFWGRLDRRGQFLSLGLAGALFVFLIAIVFWSSQSGMAPLYFDLPPEDGGKIIAYLSENGIPYTLQNNGRTILVPEDRVHELRLTLASQGAVTGGVVGFELFQESRLGMTDYDRRVRYLWALQGELVRTIREYREVKDARVHIVIPDPSPFVSSRQEASASVLLNLHPHAQLDRRKIQGIANLVAGSVEGLKPQNVTIVDNEGNVLSDLLAQEGSISGVASSQLEYKQSVEKALQDSIVGLLEPVFGRGRVVARVSTVIDFDHSESRREIFEPIVRDRGILRSEQEVVSTSRNGAQAMGVPGVDANVPGYEGITGSGGESEYRETIRNYELNRIEEFHIAAPGSVRQMSVAVFIDRDLDPAQLSTVRNSVASAVGIQTARGDQLSVEVMQFTPAPQANLPVWSDEPAKMDWGWQQGIWILLVLMGLGFVVLMWQRGRRTPQVAVTEVIPTRISEEERELPEKAKERELERLVRQKPEDVASVIRTWMAEE